MLGFLSATPVLAASNVIQYTYDAAGNIIGIQRVNPAPITLSGFTPGSGPVGTLVTITGTGFSPTPASNTVTFNGTAATVGSASATTLTATVPAAATTGKVAVTVGGNTATSAQDFVVTVPGAPTISSFTPTAGPAGTAVTVNGTNFNPSAGATTVKLNTNAATVSSVTSTQLVFAVPAATGSGKISVTTSAGTAISASDFIVPPGGIAASDIVSTTRIVANGPSKSTAIFTSYKYGLILFDGNVGDWLSLQFTNYIVNPNGSNVTYTVYKPDNTQLTTGTLSSAVLSVHLPQLATAGTYAVLLSPGLATMTVDTRLEINRTIPVDTAPLAVATTLGQSVRMLIAGTASVQKALTVSGMSTTPANYNVTFTVSLPSGGTFQYGTVYGLGATTLLKPFSVTGTHPVLFSPLAGTTQSNFLVGLRTGVSFAVDGPALDLTIPNPGEGARITFAGTAGDNLGLGITNLVLSPTSATYVTFNVYKPDATLLAGGNCYTDGTQCSANLANLPVTGTYNIIVQPESGATGTMKLWLSHDVSATLISGTPFSLALARPGQNGRLTFSGTAGALTAFQVRAITTTPASQGIFAGVYKPDGSMLAFLHVTGLGGTIVAPPLPVTGTYTVFLEPESAVKGAATASMEVLIDPGQSLVIDGPTLNSTITVAGGSFRYTFAGTAGQNLGMACSNLALNPSANATFLIYKPDGTSLTSSFTCDKTIGGSAGNLTNLPTTGTYGVVVQPASGATGSFSITLSSDVGGNLTLDTPLALTLSRPGQNGRLTFSATAGDTAALAFSQIATQPAGKLVYMTLLKPDGTSLAGNSTSTVSDSIYFASLPVTGTYQVFIDPINHYTASMMVTRLGGVALPIDGASVTSTIANPGDAVRYTFSGTAGQNLGLGISAMTMTPPSAGHQVTAYSPTAAIIGSTTCYASSGGCSLNLSKLPSTGSYSVLVQSTQGGVGNLTATLSTDLPGTLTVGGAALPINLARPGQNARLTFAGTAGQTLHLNWSSVVITGSNTNAIAYIYKPDGTTLTSSQMANGSTSSATLPALPVTGTYTIFIDPPAAAASMSLTLSIN